MIIETKHRRIREHAGACLLGVAIGDALGMPVETMRHHEIAALNGGRSIADFMPAQQTRIDDTRRLAAGSTTDDWQLTVAVAQSLIREGGIVVRETCMEAHLAALREGTFGWGKTTQLAVEAYGRGERDVHAPLPAAAPGKGCGNGIIMKCAPLAIVAALTCTPDSLAPYLRKECETLGELTHPDPIAGLAAYPVARFIAEALTRGIRTLEDAMSLLGVLIAETERHPALREKLQAVATSHGDAATLREVVGCGFWAPETMAFAIGTFIRHRGDFRAAVLEAVNAGGDADTNGAVVGALAGANLGLQEIPATWQVMGFAPNPLQLADELIDACDVAD